MIFKSPLDLASADAPEIPIGEGSIIGLLETPGPAILDSPTVSGTGPFTSTYGLVAVNFFPAGPSVISISAAAGVQSHASVVATGNGNAVSLYFDGPSGQIVGRTLSPTGALGPVATLTTAGAQLDFNAAGDNEPVSAARLSNGNIVVTWSANSAIYARVFTATLAPVTGEILVGSPTVGFAHEYYPDVAALAGGDFVVAWQDLLGASESHIRIGRFTSAGAAVTNFTADAPSNLSDERPSIAGLSDGGYALGFDRRDNTPQAATSVYGAVYNADNSVRSAVTFLDGTGSRDVDVVAHAGGGFSLYYEDFGGLGHGSNISIITSTDGMLHAGQAFSGTLDSTTNDHDVTAVDSPDGFTFVTWTDTFSATDHDPRGALISPTGEILVNNSEITGAADLGTASGAFWLDRGTVAVVYESNKGSAAADKDGAVEMRAFQVQRTTTGTAGNDTIDLTNDGLSNRISGGGGDDILKGGVSGDLLDGGSGVNHLYGGLGDDEYYVTTGTDTIIENAGEGFDYVVTTLSSYMLPANVEGLQYGSGSSTAFAGIGNELDNIIYGGYGSDVLSGLEGNDYLVGNLGNDYLRGGPGDDELDGDAGINALFGGPGNDRLIVRDGGDGTTVDGGADTDTLVVIGPVSLGGLTGVEAVELQTGAALRLTGAQFNSFAPGTPLSGTGSIAISIATTDLEVNAQYLTVANGSTISFTIYGSDAADAIKGSIGAANTINGGEGGDQIRGGQFVDTINGGIGDDKIAGVRGADILTGGSGADTFRYLAAQDSGIGAAADHITDFVVGTDKLGFTLIDADPVVPGDQAFSFIGTAAFANTGVGQIHYLTSGADLLVQVDVDGNGVTDMDIVLNGLAGHALTAADFLL